MNEIRDAPRGRDRVTLEMHLEAEVECTQRGTSSLRSTELEDAIGDRD